MALPTSNFLLSWWYTPTTKLGIYFNNFGIGNNTQVLSSAAGFGLDYANGLSCSIEEDYHFENLITNHPVENTPAISDHIIAQPRIITITGLITSIRVFPFITSLSSIGISSLDFSQLGNATQILIDMYEKSSFGISLTTGLLYGNKYLRVDNLAIQSLDIPRNNTYGRTSIKFTIVLKQLIITSKNGNITTSSFSQALAADGVDL